MEKIIVGKQMTKKDVIQILIKNVAFIIIYYGFFYLMLGVMMRNYFEDNILIGSLLALVISFPILISFCRTIISGSLAWQYLEVNNNFLIFNEKKELKDSLDEAKAIYKNTAYPPSIQIQLSDLVSVKISSLSRLGDRGIIYVLLILECCLSDGTMVKIKPEALKSNPGDYANILNFLEKKGICILDPDDLRKELTGSYIEFQENVIKHKKGKEK